MSDTQPALAVTVPTLTTFSLSLPIAMGYIPLGAVFGFLLVKAGAACLVLKGIKPVWLV